MATEFSGTTSPVTAAQNEPSNTVAVAQPEALDAVHQQ